MCPRAILDASIPGTITSPGFETGTYPPNQNCEYILRSQGNVKLKITFTVFSLDDHYNCLYDSLTILHRRNGMLLEIAKFCGSKLPNELIVEGDEISIHFVSDAYNQRRGFRLDYRVIKGTQGYFPVFYAGYESVYAAHKSPQTDCGKRQWTESNIDSNILGGKPVESGKKWPWIVYIHDGNRFCSGSIINDKWILTAGHCVQHAKPTDNAFVARAAVTDIRRHSPVREVAEIIIHPENQGTKNADIALLRLTAALPMSDEIKPICYTDISPDSSMQCYAIGWGRKTLDGPFSSVLHEVRIPLWDDRRCRKRVGAKMKDTMMCAGEATANVCAGDSGGPLMCFDRSRSQWTIIGITSFGTHCGSLSPISVFTKVAPYFDWIQKTINNTP